MIYHKIIQNDRITFNVLLANSLCLVIQVFSIFEEIKNQFEFTSIIFLQFFKKPYVSMLLLTNKYSYNKILCNGMFSIFVIFVHLFSIKLL